MRSWGWELTAFVAVMTAVVLSVLTGQAVLGQAAMVATMILTPLVLVSVVVRIVARVVEPFLVARVLAIRARD